MKAHRIQGNVSIKSQFRRYVRIICRQFRYIRQSDHVYRGRNLKEPGYDG